MPVRTRPPRRWPAATGDRPEFLLTVVGKELTNQGPGLAGDQDLPTGREFRGGHIV